MKQKSQTIPQSSSISALAMNTLWGWYIVILYDVSFYRAWEGHTLFTEMLSYLLVLRMVQNADTPVTGLERNALK